MDVCNKCKGEVCIITVDSKWLDEVGYGDIPDSEYICLECNHEDETE